MGSVDVESFLPEVETGDPPSEPDAKLNIEAPPDKEPIARADDGKFVGKDKPEAKEKEPAKEPAKAKEPDKTEHSVPVRTLVEERRQWLAERKALEERLAKLESPPKPPEAPPEDPKAYADFKVKAALEELAGTKKQVEQLQQSTQAATAQTEEMRFGQHLQAAEAAFVQEKPDYYEAVTFVRNIRAQQLKLLMPGITDQQLMQQIGQEEMGLAMNLARAGRNPVTTVYELAQAYGYQPKAAGKSEELPKLPGQKQLPPDQTLGTAASGVPDDKDTKDEESDPFEDAFKEMFGRSRKTA